MLDRHVIHFRPAAPVSRDKMRTFTQNNHREVETIALPIDARVMHFSLQPRSRARNSCQMNPCFSGPLLFNIQPSSRMKDIASIYLLQHVRLKRDVRMHVCTRTKLCVLFCMSRLVIAGSRRCLFFGSRTSALHQQRPTLCLRLCLARYF